MTRRRDHRGSIELPMPISGFQSLIGGNIALDFANTVDIHSEARSYDYLFPGYGNLISWSLYANILTPELVDELMHLAKRDPRETAAVRKRAVALRESIFEILTKPGLGHEQHLQILNDEWHLATSHRQLIASTSDASQLEWVWGNGPLLDRPLWPVVLSAIDLVTATHPPGVKVCESPECDLMFIDTTKNGSRRFCRADICGNRTRVQRFRKGKRIEHS